MPETYVNRRGDTYYLHEGKTKTGKSKYYCSKTRSENVADNMPEGFEWHEHSDSGMVSVRKRRPSRILPAEKQMPDDGVHQIAKLKHFLIEQNADDLTVFLPDRNPEDVERLMSRLLPISSQESAAMRDWTLRNVRYTAMMRFVLKYADRRLFLAERYCFRGSIDGWIQLSPPAPLELLLKEFVPHLGQESFFDLIPGG